MASDSVRHRRQDETNIVRLEGVSGGWTPVSRYSSSMGSGSRLEQGCLIKSGRPNPTAESLLACQSTDPHATVKDRSTCRA